MKGLRRLKALIYNYHENNIIILIFTVIIFMKALFNKYLRIIFTKIIFNNISEIIFNNIQKIIFKYYSNNILVYYFNKYLINKLKNNIISIKNIPINNI